MTALVPLAEQIAEVRRELALRRNVYPQRVAAREMRQAEADHLTSRMEGVLTSLLWFQDHEHEIRAYFRLSAEDRAIVATHGALVAQLAHEVAKREALASAGGPVR